MDQLKFAVESFVLDPRNRKALSLIKAARNGAVYGAKVRFPHALVMVFLFRHGSLQEKLGIVVKATRQHARNLASFAFLYKFILFALGYAPRDRRQTEKEGSYNTFVAGLVAGYVVFGRGIQSSVNQQIVIYVFGRVVLALAKLAVQKGQLLPHDASEWLQARSWSIFASFSWAAVMWLFRWHPDSLQPSLRSSMKYMYVWLIVGLAPVLWLADIYSYSNADIWDSFRNFLIYNS